jgi:hypothetical protein
MTRDEILALCRKAPAVGQVKHEDFADYVVVIAQSKHVGDEWITVESAYMTVEGKIAMANADHRLQGKRLDFENPQVLVDNDEQLTLLVTVTSELYGRRHGVATSRKRDGTPAEQNFPWEVAETSGIGRALSAMGYGLLPGAGLASADDIMRAMQEAPARAERRARPRAPSPRSGQAAKPPAPMSAYQRQQLIKTYRQLHEVDEAEAEAALEKRFAATFRHGLAEATYAEGTKVMAELLAEKKKSGK